MIGESRLLRDALLQDARVVAAGLLLRDELLHARASARVPHRTRHLDDLKNGVLEQVTKIPNTIFHRP